MEPGAVGVDFAAAGLGTDGYPDVNGIHLEKTRNRTKTDLQS
jgi:hypothetical protein